MGDGAESGVTTHFPLEFRITCAGGFSVAGGIHGRFLGENTGDFQFTGFFSKGEGIISFQPVAQAGEQGIPFGAGEVVYFYPGGIDAPSRAAAGHQRLPAAVTGGDEVGLGYQGVNGVNDDIRFRRQQFFRVGGRVETVDGDDFRFRVDFPEACGHGFRFGLPDCGRQRMYLPVGVGDAKVVHIHQNNGAYS